MPIQTIAAVVVGLATLGLYAVALAGARRNLQPVAQSKK